MTDETRPETTPSAPAPDGDSVGAVGKDASLDSWFRPARVAEPGEGGDETSVRASESGSGTGTGSEVGRGMVASAQSGDDRESAAVSDVAGEGESAEQADVSGGAEEGAGRSDRAEGGESGAAASGSGSVSDQTQVIPVAAEPTQAIPRAALEPTEATPRAAVDPTEAIPRAAVSEVDALSGARGSAGASSARPSDGDMAVRPSTSRSAESYGSGARKLGADRAEGAGGAGKPGMDRAEGAGAAEHASWSPAPGPQPQYDEGQPQQRPEPWQPQQYQPAEEQPSQDESAEYERAQYQSAPSRMRQRPYQQQQPQTQAYEAPGGVASILPPRGHADYDDFDNYSFADGAKGQPPRGRKRRALLATGGVFLLIVAVAAALVFSGKVHAFGIGAKPVPTVGFSPSGSDAGSDATQTGTAFLTAWENGNLKAAANITDNQSAALAALTAYKSDLKLSGLTLMPGTASAQGWMTFNVTAQVGTPSSAWSYSSGMATYSTTINGYTRWFVKWQPSVLFTSLKSGQKLALGAIPPVANKVVDKNGTEITPANAPSLNGIVSALKKSAPPAAGTPGQQVQIDNADGSFASKVAKLTDPVTTGAVKTTIDLNVQNVAQSAVNQAPNSSMVVLQPSTGDILAVANNPTTGLDTAMLGKYAPGSTFKTVTSTLVLNKGVISDLNQTWDCPLTLNADGIVLHNSEQEQGVGNSFLTDFAQSCNNAFSRFGSEHKVSRDELVSTAHDYYGFDQKWDVGLNAPTVYGHVPNSSSNSLAEELVGQDQIQANPLTMASVAATVATGSFKQPILVPGTKQITATPLPAKTDQDLKTLMHQVVVNGTLAGILPVDGVYAKTGTAEVGDKKTPNSWTIAFQGDFAVAALAVGGNFGATTAGPEVKTLLAAVH